MTAFLVVLGIVGLILGVLGFWRFLGTGAGILGLICFGFGVVFLCIAVHR